MDHAKFSSAIAATLKNLSTKPKEPTSVDIGMFVSAVKKELIGLKIPVYNVYVSRYRDNVIVVELPFCKSCEIQVNSVEFGSDELSADLYIDKSLVRSIKLAQFDNAYMIKVAVALVDYFKRFLLLKNKFKG